MNIAMWKYQGIYDLLNKDKRFRLFVFLSPIPTYSYESRCADLRKMRSYFKERNIPFVDYELEKGKAPVDVRSVVEPDILFYTQPYEKNLTPNNDFLKFKNKLLCYAPYGFSARNNDYYRFDTLYFNTIAWKLYFPSEENKDLLKRDVDKKDHKMVVVGYLGADDYIMPLIHDVWKCKDKAKKRIIWAPHFTITKGAKLSNFLSMAEFMREIAVEYSDRITIAFKPHPRLYSELERHPEWGVKRTMEYYNFWKTCNTTQLETGDFIDLFKGSDALIHDSASFTLDYLYFNKPVLYDNPNIDAAKATANKMGKAAYDVHYTITSNDGIKCFIDDVVLAGNDPMKIRREEYYNKYLLPPNGKTVAQNIYEDLIKSLGI